LDIQELRQEFIHYLDMHYNYADPGHMASEVFYSYRHNIGMPFEEIFSSEQTMGNARELLIRYFQKIHRKDPKHHASIHYGYWIKFKEFLDASGKTL